MSVPVYPIPAVRHAWGDTAVPWNGITGDIADPGDNFVSTGWPQSTTPPPYQWFNWALNWAAGAVRYIMQNGITDWQTLELYQTGAIVVYQNVVYQSLINSNTGHIPLSSPTQWGPLAGYATIAMLAPYATTAQVLADLAAYAPLNSPNLAGIPRSPTASAGDSSTIIANTAFVTAALAAALNGYLTNAVAAATYLTIASAAATYLTKALAASTYLTQSAAASTYATQAFATGQFAANASFVWDIQPGSGIMTLSGVTPSIPQGVNTNVVFPKAFANACVGVQLTPFGPSSAGYVLVSFTPTLFTMRTGAGEPFCYTARGF